MRFMMIMFPKGYENAKPGWVPDFKSMEKMGAYNEELGKAGVLLALDGLTPPATMSARVTFKNGKSTAIPIFILPADPLSQVPLAWRKFSDVETSNSIDLNQLVE